MAKAKGEKEENGRYTEDQWDEKWTINVCCVRKNEHVEGAEVN